MSIKKMLSIAVLLVITALFVIAISCGGGSDTATQGATALDGSNAASGSDVGGPGDRPVPDAKPGDMRPGADHQDGEFQDREGGHGGWRGHPIMGVITALTEGSLTLKPEMPEFINEHFNGRDSDRPHDLPAEVSVVLNADTAFYEAGEKLDSNPYVEGDRVAAWVFRTEESDRPVAKMLCDAAGFQAKMRERMGEGGGHHGDWQRDGVKPGYGDRQDCDPGAVGHGEKFRKMMPHFGTITAITDNSITITPEIPEFIREKMKDHPGTPDWDLPESITFMIDAETGYYLNGEETRPGTFSVGDKVLVVRRITDVATDRPIAAKICDYASMKKRGHGKFRGHGCPVGDRPQSDGDQA